MSSPITNILRRLKIPVRDVRVPIRLQFQTTECGVGALAMLLGHYGRYVTMEDLRAATGVSRDCVNAAEVVRAGRHYGLECRAYSREPYMLRTMKPPFIVHVRFIHFMIVEGYTDDEVLLADPHRGRMKVPWEVFEEDFTGVVIEARPGERFIREGRDIDPLVSLWKRADSRSRIALVRAAAMSAFAAVLLPCVALGLGLWGAVTASGRGGGIVAAYVLSALGAWTGLSLLARHWQDRAREIVSDGQAALLARHYAAMPAGFFAYRIPSRLHESLGSGDAAVGMLCGTIVSSAARLLMLPVALALLWVLSPVVGFAVSLLAIAGIGAMEVLYRTYGEALRLRMLAGDEEAGELHAGREDFTDSKLSGKDQEFVQSRLAAISRGQKSLQQAAPLDGIVEATSAICVIGVMAMALLFGADGAVSSQLAAIALMMPGLAAALAMQGWLPLRRSFDAARQELLYIDDLLQSKVAEPGRDAPTVNAGLPPDIAIRATALTFGYSSTRQPLIRDVSLDLRRGEQLGIAGPSGGGKSTLAALLAGDLQPWSGAVELGAMGVSRCIAWVNKSTFFFDGTVRANLTLWDDSVTEEAIHAAISDACLDDVLAARAGGLDSLVKERGRNFSGGQRQRFEIARALLRNPAILVLDEATDALDPALEARIRDNVRRRGVALVMVSHRSSTLAACDRVVHVDQGRLTSADDVTDMPCVVSEPPPGPPVVDDAVAEPLPDLDRLSSAFAHVAARLGLESRPTDMDEVRQGHMPPIAALARAHGMHVRAVRINVPRWWRMVEGPLVCVRSDNREPVVLVESGCQRRFVDPDTGDTVDIAPCADLEPDAWAFQPLLEARQLDTRGVIARGVAAARGRLVGLMLIGAAGALCLLALVPFAHRAFDGAHGLPLPLLAAIASMLAVAGGLFQYVRATASVRTGAAIRIAAMGLFVQKPVRVEGGYLMGLSVDRLLRATNALHRALHAVTGEHLSPLADVAGPLLVIVMLAWLHPGYAIAGSIVFAIVAGLPWLLAVQRVPREVRIEEKRLVSRRFLLDTLTGIFRLRLLDTAATALERWVRMHRNDMRRDGHVRRFDAACGLLRDAAPWFAVSFMLIASPAANDMHPWMLAAAIMLAWFLASTAGKLGAALVALARSQPLIELSDVLGTAPLEPDPPPMKVRPRPIVLENVTYRYPGVSTAALQDLCLRVEPGEFVAITGPSGGGKSTLLKLILGFDEPASGRVIFDGPLGPAAERVVWRRSVGLVGQDERLQFASTLRSQVSGLAPYGVEAVWEVLRTVLMADDVRRMSMGMQTIVETGKVSTGQEQRLVIARALLCKPSVLILDEATNAIPDAMQARLFENLRAMGITLILVTHRETAIAHMDRVVIVERGGVSWSGTPAELQADASASAILAAEREEGHL